jgi:hypothetical protein
MPKRSEISGGLERDAVLERIAEEHARFLYRVAYSLLRHAQDAEDAVQDALLKLYRGGSVQDVCIHAGLPAPAGFVTEEAAADCGQD